MGLLFEKKYSYTVNNRDCFDNIAPWTVFDFFQDIAGKQVEEYKCGFNDLIEKGLIWVLIRNKYDVIKQPSSTENMLLVKTWQSSSGRADFIREYQIYSEAGELLVIGSSVWCLVDYKTRRIVPSSAININLNNPDMKAYDTIFSKLNFPSLENEEVLFFQKINYSKIDHNGHLNNSKYSEMIMDAICLEKDEEVKAMEINYLKEAFLGQTVSLKKKVDNNVIYVEGYRDSDMLFKAKVTKSKSEKGDK